MKKWNVACLLAAILVLFSGCIQLNFNENGPLFPPIENPIIPMQTTGQNAVIQTQSAQAPTVAAPVGNDGAANWSKAEILSFFNNAVNRAKTADTYTLTRTLTHSMGLTQINNESMREMANGLTERMNRQQELQYSVQSTTATDAYGNAFYANDLIMPTGRACALTDADVLAARASFDGENVIIVLSVADCEASLAAPVPNSGISPYLPMDNLSSDPFTVSDARILYSKRTVAAGINNAGRLVTVTATANAAVSTQCGIGVMTAQADYAGTLKEVIKLVY